MSHNSDEQNMLKDLLPSDEGEILKIEDNNDENMMELKESCYFLKIIANNDYIYHWMEIKVSFIYIFSFYFI
jgi:hypothetical protein